MTTQDHEHCTYSSSMIKSQATKSYFWQELIWQIVKNIIFGGELLVVFSVHLNSGILILGTSNLGIQIR